MYYGTICRLVAKFRTKQQQFEDAATVNYNKTDAKYARPMHYSKTWVKRPLSKGPKLDFKPNYRLMQVKCIAKRSKWSILQTLRPSFSYHLSLSSLFCLFLSGRFTQDLLYSH